MMTFDLFHAAADDGTFALSINESPPLQFASRVMALRYAVSLANQRHQHGLDYAINIEGGDGRWRLVNSSWRLSEAGAGALHPGTALDAASSPHHG